MKSAVKVRKQFILDAAKIELVKKITKSITATEAINKALDIVITNEKINNVLAAMKGKGAIKDVYNRVSC